MGRQRRALRRNRRRAGMGRAREAGSGVGGGGEVMGAKSYASSFCGKEVGGLMAANFSSRVVPAKALISPPIKMMLLDAERGETLSSRKTIGKWGTFNHTHLASYKMVAP